MNLVLFRKIVDSVRDSVIVIDNNETVIYWNKSAKEQFGYSSEQAVGASLKNLIIPSCYSRVHADLHKYDVDNQFIISDKLIEITARRKDGSLFPAEVSISSVILDDNWYAVGIVRDISKRRLQEEEIHKLSRAVEQSPSMVLITGLDGNIVYVNPKFTAITGYSFGEINGENPRILNSGKMPDNIYQDLWITISIGEEWRGELLNRKKNGELYWESVSCSPIRNSNEVITHYLKVSEDITDRKHVEQALKMAKEAAEKASLAKSEFLANMSHEIRTPMNIIIGMTDYLMKISTDEHTKQTQSREKQNHEYISMINDSAKLLLSIINQILDFSKIEANKLELLHEPFKVYETISRLIKIQTVAAQEKSIGLFLDYDKNIPSCLMGDAVRLQQILINLIGNAIKFTEKGHVNVNVKLLEHKSSQVKLKISVIDTGIGIPYNKLGSLFKSFNQVDNSLSRQYDGTGLGLAISKRLVELMGGRITVNSTEGVGSEFSFTVILNELEMFDVCMPDDIEMDIVEIDNASVINVNIDSDEQNNIKILLVEDKAMNQKLAKLILEKKGWRVVVANNGREALEIVEQDVFDIILMDIQMPELDGISATKKIRKLDGNKNQMVPIIAMTANVYESDREKYIQYGMNGYVAKPFDMEDLYNAVKAYL